MSSLPTKPKSRTPLLAAVALTAVVGAGAYVAHMKGAFRPSPVVDIGALPAFPDAAPMHPDAVGTVDPMLAGVVPELAPPPVPAALSGETPMPATSPQVSVPAAATEAQSAASTEVGLSADQISLMDLRQRAEMGRARLEAMRVDIENRQAEEVLHGTAIGANQLPELVGLSGAAPNIMAEFLVGNRIIQARKGDWVTRDWQLTNVLATGVTMTRRGGKDARTILFGDTPMDAQPSSVPAAIQSPQGFRPQPGVGQVN